MRETAGTFFSVIIPAYNTAHYLPMCIDSLLVQSCGDFEIILIDDASTDGTGEVADQLASIDARIHVFHISHAGVSAARNVGLKAAEGEYALFLDSDDMLVPDALESIRTKLWNSPDMLWFGFLYRGEDGSEYEGQKLNDVRYADTSKAVADWIQNDIMPMSACNKAFRLSVIKKFGIVFREEYSFGEDRLFNLDYLKCCRQIVTSSDNLYVCVARNGSASRRFVPGMLSILLTLHQEKLSTLLQLCGERIPDREWRLFSEMDYVESVKSAWLHLVEYYPAMTDKQKSWELEPYLDIQFPERINWMALRRWTYVITCIWLSALKIAVRLNSLPMLRLLMYINSLIYGKMNT